MENIDNKNVGICFDSGHYHAFFNDELDFSKHKDRIFALHLHDNDQSGDQHLIPFDGTLDWENVINNLKFNNYNGPITMEFVYSEKYFDMGMEAFYKKGYEIGKKLKEMFENA
jgi:sugar phosphate isomerase/epimerase